MTPTRLQSVVLGCSLFAASAAEAQTLARKPYLQQGSSTSAVVVWRTAEDTDGVVHWGTAPGQLTQTARSTGTAKQHVVKLSGLQPNTRYYYDVGTSSKVLAGGDADHFVQTAPPVGTKKKFRAWVVGDSGTGGKRQDEVTAAMLDAVGADKPDLYIHVGDMAYGSGLDNEFTTNFFAMYPHVMRNTVCWPAMGNHEGKSADSDKQTGPYYEGYVLPKAAEAGGLQSGTEAYYSFDYANVHFVVLDSHQTSRFPQGAMMTWLKNDLAATTQDWIIAYWHHPPYTKGSHDSDTEINSIEMRAYALPILEAAGVDLVLTGHSHVYERSWLLNGATSLLPTVPTTANFKDKGDGKPLGSGPYHKSAGLVGNEGAVHVVAGHGGTGVKQEGTHPVMFFTEPENGSCVIDVQENRLELVNVRWDGAQTDRFAIVKGQGLVLASPQPGELLIPGSTRDIRWASAGSTERVALSYSTDNGTTWTPIADNVYNYGEIHMDGAGSQL